MADEPAAAPPRLDELQRFLLTVVTDPDGVERGVERAVADGALPGDARTLSDVVPGGPRLTPIEQLHIYGYAYFARIVDVLADELPSVRALLGEDAFEAAMRRYLQAHPSRSWTLDHVSEDLPAWLEAQASGSAEPARWRVAADLARVERALDAVWDEPFVDPVGYEELAAIPMDAWASARLEPIPALRLLTLGHPVTDLMNHARDGSGDAVPSEALPGPLPSWMCVHRDDARRWRFPLDRAQFTLLSALVRGASVGEALEEVAGLDEVSLDALLGALGDWFRDWMGSGLFAAVIAEE